MGILVKQDGERSELQQKIAADIAARQRAAAKAAELPPDGVNDSRFIEGTTSLSRRAWIMLICVIILAIGLIVYIATR